MNQKSLAIYFVVLIILSAAWIVGAKLVGEQGRYLAQAYMMTPAIAAFITRLFFYENRFKDANLRFGRLSDYGRYWLSSVAISILSYVLFTLFGAITWDLTGNVFLGRLSEQFAAVGQDMVSKLIRLYLNLLVNNLPIEQKATVIAVAEDLAERWQNLSGLLLPDAEWVVVQLPSRVP